MSDRSADANETLARAYALSGAPDDVQQFYKEWAENYDKDVSGMQYTFPQMAAEALAEVTNQDLAKVRILDAGCGTGLVGVCLAQLGAKNIEGLDISPEMLQRASQTSVYTNLEVADLTKSIARQNEEYDAAICVGTLTKGHLGPQLLDELIRVVKRNGYLAATIGGGLWQHGGFKTKVDELVKHKSVTIVKSTGTGVTISKHDAGWLVVLKRL
ncbi:hypothetical protein LTR05_007234 [Lithohypha guttulata]|uniref:Methyltransferase domain-containing protein n=1 Tax=Lithohypha guttulata TaxID=1690604 RepID=A0AAN7SUS0_9EURO|nr:hypothetical protein LTR05_007234 [Lithohypha guttulata]